MILPMQKIRNVFLIGILLIGCSGSEDDPKATETLDYDVYVSDVKNKILRFSGEALASETFITESLNWPQDIVFLEQRNEVLVSSLNTGEIVRYHINTGQLIDKFASGLGGPTRMKIGKDNLLYVLQWSGNGKVLRYKPDGTFVDEFTETGVPESIGLDWDAQGNLYVSSYNKGSGGYVRKFDSQGKDLGNFVSLGSFQAPTNIWFNANGDLLMVDYQSGTIRHFDKGGKFIKNEITGLSKPEGLAVIDDGRFLVGDGGSGTVKMYGPDFRFLKDIIQKGAGGLSQPNAVILRKR